MLIKCFFFRLLRVRSKYLFYMNISLDQEEGSHPMYVYTVRQLFEPLLNMSIVFKPLEKFRFDEYA